MENKYYLENSIEKIEQGRSSFFLDPNEKKYVVSRLNKKHIPYDIYKPYEEAEKVLIYSGKFPNIELLEIKSKENLEHREILGCLFSHQIEPQFYSDIMITDTHYLVALKSIATYLKENVSRIGKHPVQIISKDIHLLENYSPKFEEVMIHTSGLRLDMFVAKITKQSRKQVEVYFQNKDIFLNYEVAIKKDILLKEGDIFSIRRYGKYKFSKVCYRNKKGNMDIEILKYK